MYLKNFLKTYYENVKKYFELQKDLFVFSSLFLDLHSDTSLRKKEITLLYLFIFIFISCMLIKEFFRYKYNYVFVELRQNQYYLTVVLIPIFCVFGACFIFLKQIFRTIISGIFANKLLSKKISEIQEKKLDIKEEIIKLKKLKKNL